MHRRNFIGGGAATLAMLLSAGRVHAGGLSGARKIKHFLFVNLQGGPSQMETWDPKPGNTNGGPTKAVKTKVPGMLFAQGLEPMAEFSDNIAVVRTVSRIGEHELGQYFISTGGFAPNPVLQHPGLCSTVGWGLHDPESDLPPVVSIGKGRSAGFLGNAFDPYAAGEKLEVAAKWRQPLEQADQMRDEYYAVSPIAAANDFQEEVKHQSRSSRLTLGISNKAFDISLESSKTRDLYGNGFGGSCLLARRLFMAGVPSVHVTLGGWDTHQNNFDATTRLGGTLSKGLSALIGELKAMEIFDQTLILVGGEMGRTPKINNNEGRDHYPGNNTFAVIGGAVKGQNIGTSSADGSSVDGGASMPQLSYSILDLMGLKPLGFFNDSVSGRPQRYCPGDNPLPRSLT
ncbi:MAG: hypothetical protein RL095_2904 [Verrucomicrobiota bacterium]